MVYDPEKQADSDTSHARPEPPKLAASRGGLLGWFATNRVAANLLMVFVLASGVLALTRLRYEVFQEIDLGLVRISVPYPGASPEEVEESICMRVEEAIRGIEGIEQITASANENAGTVVAELEDYADGKEVRDDIEQAIDLLQDFPPEDAEEPDVVLQEANIQAISVVIYGETSERSLKELAERVRDELTAFPEISLVEVSGVRDYEISIEVSEEALRRYRLTFAEVADAVRRSSLDLPAGNVKTQSGDILLRSVGQRYVGEEFAAIPVMTREDGSQIRVGDVAEVVDGFEDTDAAVYFNGQRAVLVQVYRTGEQGVLQIEDRVQEYVATRAMPAGVQIDTWGNRASHLRGRAELLVRNATIGLVLVFICLSLFLDLRLAFWTTLGIPISFMGSFFLMLLAGVSVNMISLFALIIVLGIVVDDAIVVGENVYEYLAEGMSGSAAAIRGVSEMALPVTLAVATTIAAFLPLMFTAGEMGKILWPISAVVVCVLLVSLVEAFLILPAHLSTRTGIGGRGPIAAGQAKVRAGLDWLVNGPYRRLLHLAVNWRYATVAIGIAVLAVTIGVVYAGIVGVRFLPKLESDQVVAQLEMPRGTPVEQTKQVVRRLEAAAREVAAEFDAQPDKVPPGHTSVRFISTTIGSLPRQGGPPRGESSSGGAGHIAGITLELLDAEVRAFSPVEFANRWQAEVGEVPGVSSLSYDAELFNVGDDVAVELSHADCDVLVQASDRLQRELRRFSGVNQIADSFEPGKRELKFELTDAGRAAGLRLSDLARQVRQGFHGEEAQRVQRGRHDIEVMVRYPESERRSLADVYNMRIRLPDGSEAALLEVAEVTEGRGYATIDRVDRHRVVTVTAGVNDDVVSPEEVNVAVAERVMPGLVADFPGLSWKFEGAQKERQQSRASLQTNMLVALLVIYALLAVLFRSYLQPLLVMSAIPFGLVGAVAGHYLLDLDLSMLSGFGLVALTGVVVNDSLIMIDLINRRVRSGEAVPLRQIVLESGMRRFRPILLTTLTTFFGLAPMILERSLQARFLVPMAVSLGFGVVFATLITLVLVPSLYLILEDIARLFRLPSPALAALDQDDERLDPQADQPTGQPSPA